MSKLYISGQMTGLPDKNYPAFFAMEKKLVQHFNIDPFLIVNPASLEENEQVDIWVGYMRNDISALVKDCTGIVMLDGWADSKGAVLEYSIAKTLGFDLFDQKLHDLNSDTGCISEYVKKYEATSKDGVMAALDAMARNPSFEEAHISYTPNPNTALTGVFEWELYDANKRDGESATYKTVLQEAEELTNGDRQKAYGHPSINFGHIAEYWQTYLNSTADNKTTEGNISVTSQDVALMMVLLKISRETNAKTRDNIVDGIGYLNTYQMIEEYETPDKHE